MLKIFTGENRTKANQEIKKTLGQNYEIIEGADLSPADLPSIFHGTSLFAETRNILIRDLSPNKAVFEQLPSYLDTPHNIIVQELKLDKRSATYKTLKSKVEIVEFALPRDPNQGLVFDIFNTAKRDSKKAVSMLESIKESQDPMMFFGLIASQALKDFGQRQGTREKRVLKELSATDLQIKSSSVDPWLLIESFLLRLSSL